MLNQTCALFWRRCARSLAACFEMLLPLQFAWLAGCKLMPVGPSRATPCAPACIESLHQSSRRSALTLLAVAVFPPLEAATAADGIAGRNERMVVPILGDLMGLAGPGAHAMPKTSRAQPSASWFSRGFFRCQTMLQAARSFGQPRPISRLGRAGRPNGPCFRHRWLIDAHTMHTVAGMPVASYAVSPTVSPTGGSLNRAQAQLGKLAESLGQLEQLTSDLTLPEYTGSGEDSMTALCLSSITSRRLYSLPATCTCYSLLTTYTCYLLGATALLDLLQDDSGGDGDCQPWYMVVLLVLLAVHLATSSTPCCLLGDGRQDDAAAERCGAKRGRHLTNCTLHTTYYSY